MATWYTSRVSIALPSDFSAPVPSSNLQTSAAATPAAEARPASRERILLVEDEDVLRQLAFAILTRQGYAVFAANGPDEALRIAAERPDSVDLILADVMMPGMRGYDLVARLHPLQPRARVLYMSGYVGGLEAAQESRILPLLAKPFKPRELLDEVRRILDA